MEEENSFLFQR